MHMRIRLITLALLLCLRRRGAGEREVPRRHRRAEGQGLRRPDAGSRSGSSASATSCRGTTPSTAASATRSASTWARAHESKQDVLVTFTARRGCYRQRQVLQEEGLPRAEREEVHEGLQGVRQDVSVGEDLLRLERDQPQVPADLQVPEARGAVLQRAAQGREEGQVPRDGGRPARHGATSPATCASSSATVKGSPKLWGLHNYGDVNYRRSTLHAPDAAVGARRGVADRDRRHREAAAPAQARRQARGQAHDRRCSSWPTSTTRSAGAIRSKITRLFVYTWFGEASVRALRRRPREPGRLAPPGVQRVQEARSPSTVRPGAPAGAVRPAGAFARSPARIRGRWTSA